MQVGELARRSGVSRSTINFYVQHHLLEPPQKLSRTRALYDQRHLGRLRIIKQLQTVHGLPLSVIRRLLEQAGDDEQLLRRLADQRGPAFAQDLVQLPDPSQAARPIYSRTDLKRLSGLDERQLKQLEHWDLLGPRGARDLFGGAELEAAKAFRRLFDLGATDEELDLYAEYFRLQRRFASRLYRHLLRSHRDAWLAQQLSGRELSRLSGTVEAYLRFRAAGDLFPETLPSLFPDHSGERDARGALSSGDVLTDAAPRGEPTRSQEAQ